MLGQLYLWRLLNDFRLLKFLATEMVSHRNKSPVGTRIKEVKHINSIFLMQMNFKLDLQGLFEFIEVKGNVQVRNLWRSHN